MKKPLVTFLVLILISIFFLIYKQKSSEVLKIGFITNLEYSQSEKEAGFSTEESLNKAISYYNYIFKPDLVINGGNYISTNKINSEIDFFDNFNSILNKFNEIKSDKLFLLGKNETGLDYTEKIQKTLALEKKYYSKIYRGFRIIILDTTEINKPDSKLGTIEENQIKWLEKELSQPEPVLIFSHQSLMEIPNQDTWQQNLTNQDQIYEILKNNHQKIIALVSNSKQNDYITKKSGLPFLNIASFNNQSSFGRFSEIKITRNHKNPSLITINLKNHGNNQSIYKIERNLKIKTDTRIELIEQEQISVDQNWFDLNDSNHPNGIVSEKSGGEPDLNITKNGNTVVAYESESNGDKIQVKIYKNGQWSKLEDEKHPEGLVSLGDAGNPKIETRDEDVFVVFTEKNHNRKNRILWWQDVNQKWVEIIEGGFLSDKPTHESTLIFDKNKENLFVAFAEQINSTQEQNQIKIKKWNGEKWEAIPTSFSFFAKSWDSDLDEIALAHSIKNDVLYIAYEEKTNDGKNLVQVKKWENNQWKNLNYSQLYSEKISAVNGFSPSLAIDENENLYLTFVENNQDKVHIYKYNQSEWLDVSPTNQTGTAIEPSITVSDQNILYLSYSEFKKDIVMFKESENDFIKTNAWRVRIKKFQNNQWLDCEDILNLKGYITKGSGKGDPALKTFKENLFVVFGDEENNYKARVKKYTE
jgi:hypothetical protein